MEGEWVSSPRLIFVPWYLVEGTAWLAEGSLRESGSGFYVGRMRKSVPNDYTQIGCLFGYAENKLSEDLGATCDG